jgi:phenylpropionate dioxygenase-like ring-hydroxylating dioxygenase large terminal subunit
MTSKSDSEILTRVGPGTPMGELMRRYWLPVLKSSELVADGDPVRLRLLGENLVSFRDSSGRIGVMDHRCPHRCASLFFGRNEENGIRCVYHGWKFDVDGKCLDMANVPPHQDFKHKVKAKAYKAAERNGVVWVYMGIAEDAPALPDIAATFIPEDEANIAFAQRECNWLQSMEGDIDTSHLNFLHYGSIGGGAFEPNDETRFGAIHKDPEYHVRDTDTGTMYAAYRPADQGNIYWRFAHFLFPCVALAPFKPFDSYRMARIWVPLDDTHTMFVTIGPKDGPGESPMVDHLLPNSTDWLGRWRCAQQFSNDYEVDRDVQRTGSYTGIEGIHQQDQAVTETMGDITDHTREHLAPSDQMITATRKRLVRAAKALAKDGTPPPASENPEAFALARGGFFIAEAGRKWPEVYEQELAAVQGTTKAAAE